MERIPFSCTITHHDYHCTATITISAECITPLYRYVAYLQKQHHKTAGFSRGEAPLKYVEHAFKNTITSHVKELIFNHFLLNIISAELMRNKVPITGKPHVETLRLEANQEAIFTVTLPYLETPIKREWKKKSFVQPKRKNYKDIDRQVTNFIEEARTEEQQARTQDKKIAANDWVLFSLTLMDEEHRPLTNHKDMLWLRIGHEDVDREAHNLFANKKARSSFTSRSPFLQRYINSLFDGNYHFFVEIIDYVSYIPFSLDQLKYHFKIRNRTDLHRKLIEIFSYRNDISQRRETIEASFKLLHSLYPISIPESLVQEQEQLILDTLYKNPDYRVYKTQKDFQEKVRMLAKKQLREFTWIDTIAYQENIQITHEDVVAYLNLLKRPRTREFICFKLPKTEVNGQERPLPAEIVRQACLREKTINYIIKHIAQTH